MRILITVPFQMNKILPGLIFFTSLILLSVRGFAQEKDFQSWNEFELEKKLSKKLTLSLSEEFRFVNNATQFDKWASSFGGNYGINKYVEIGLFYRYAYSRDLDGENENGHRVYGDIAFSYKIQRVSASYRMRYQYQVTTPYISREGISNEQYLRNRIKVKYNVPKIPLNPYVEIEYYYSLNNPYGQDIDRSRYTLGADYSITKHLSAGLYYRIQYRRESFNNPQNSYVLGTSVGYRF